MSATRPARVDPMTWAVVGAVALLAAAALASLLITRPTLGAGSLKTPGGVVTAFVLAIQAGRADEAWSYVSPNATQGSPGKPVPAGGPAPPSASKDEFQREVSSLDRQVHSRIRILGVTQDGDAASVQLEITTFSANPLGGASSHTVTVMLARQAGSWLITSDPSPYQFE